MVNFKLYPGLWVKVEKELTPDSGLGDTLYPGQTVQILWVPKMGRTGLTFVGIRGIFYQNYIGRYLSPLEL